MPKTDFTGKFTIIKQGSVVLAVTIDGRYKAMIFNIHLIVYFTRQQLSLENEIKTVPKFKLCAEIFQFFNGTKTHWLDPTHADTDQPSLARL